MKKLLFLILFFISVSANLRAQGTLPGIGFGPAVPPGCNSQQPSPSPVFYLTSVQGSNQPGLYTCKADGTYAAVNTGGGVGNVTHTGNLTALHLMLGNGIADSTVDSACVTNGTGALSGCTSISTTGNVTGANLPAALPTTPNGVSFIDTSTPSGGVSQAPAWSWPGEPIRAATGTTDTILAADRSSLITESNVGAIAVTLPQAGTTNFANNFNFGLCNIGAGTATITPTISTINGAATLVLVSSRCGYVYSDNSNYYASVTYYGVPNAVVTNPSATQTITATGAATLPLAIVSPASASNYSISVRDNAGNLIMGVDPEAAGAVSFYEAGGAAGRVNIGNTSTNNFIVVDPNINLTTTLGGVQSLYGRCSQAAANGHATANTITDECPAAVTAYENIKPGVSATGLITNNVAAAVVTQGFSGDANHSATVTIGSGTSIGSTQLCSSANCPVGTYAVHVYVDITTPCGTTGTYVVNLIYTDDQGSKTIPVNINGTGAVPATGVLTTTSTANFGEDVQVIRLTSGNLNYSTTAGACGTAGPMVGKLYMAAVPVM